MSTIGVDNPNKWLLAEIGKYLSPEQLESLLAAYETQKRRYYHAVKVHDAERRVRIYSRWPVDRDPTRLARWQARLAKLKAEWEAMNEEAT
jgi:sRNA-binding protein